MRKFEIVGEKFLEYGEKEIILPRRATTNSAGYDFYSPINVVINPKESKLVFTNVKACFNKDEVLLLCVTSGMGKRGLMLSNNVGVIDSDYYQNPQNDGNIGFRLYNFFDTPYEIKKGEKIGQGIFMKFLTVDDEEEITTKRVGGFGSTDKK